MAGSLSLGIALLELVLALQLDARFSHSSRLARFPHAGLSDLTPDGPLLYRLDRLAKTEDSLTLQTADGARQYSLKKPADRLRIVALGDSLTEIWFQPGYRNWTDLLQERLSRTLGPTEVLPLGVGGYNTHHEVTWLTGELGALEADLIVLQMTANDSEVMRLRPREATDFSVPDVNCPTPPSVATGAFPDAAEQTLWPKYDVVSFDCRERTFDRFLGSRSLWLLNRVLFQQRSDQAHGTRLIPADGRQRKALNTLRDFARAKKVDLLAVILPLFHEQTQVEAQYHRRLLGEAQVEWLDLSDEMARGAGLVTYRTLEDDPYHPSLDGHRRIADLVARRLLEVELRDRPRP